jgi:hypothetical protein
MQDNNGSNARGGSNSSGEAQGDAPIGSTTLNSSPPTRDPADNPVMQTGRDAPDVLAEQVRDGTFKTAQEHRDDQRGQ